MLVRPVILSTALGRPWYDVPMHQHRKACATLSTGVQLGRTVFVARKGLGEELCIQHVACAVIMANGALGVDIHPLSLARHMLPSVCTQGSGTAPQSRYRLRFFRFLLAYGWKSGHAGDSSVEPQLGDNSSIKCACCAG